MTCVTTQDDGPRGDTSCEAYVVAPGRRTAQLQARGASASVTSQTRTGIRGCLIRKRCPIARVGPSSGSSAVIDAVHEGHRWTSAKTSHTRSAEAAMSTKARVITYQTVRI